MLKNNLKLILRQLWQHRTFSLVNILGLTLGTACCLYILFYAMEQFQYDRHHRDVASIFRVATNIRGETSTWESATLSPPIVPALGTDFPEVESWTRLVNPPDVSQHLLKWNQTTVYETKGYYVDSTFFEVFTYPWLEGSPESALDEPYTVVLTKAVAEKLFGRRPAVGESIRITNTFGDNPFQVTGVVDPADAPSHIRAHFYMTLNSGGLGEFVRTNNSWAGNNFIYGYVKLKPQSLAGELAAKFPDFLERHGGEQFRERDMHKELVLEPVRDIHLFSDRDNQLDTTVSSSLLYILLTIAGFIQFLACINFMNLTTARSTLRAREVGIRKTIGAGRAALAAQFLTEAILLTAIAFALAIPLVRLALPWLNQMTGSSVTGDFSQYPLVWLLVGALLLITGLLSGSYPAFYLSGFKPVHAFKTDFRQRGFSATRLRKALVVLQFTVSVALIIGAVLIYQQLVFFQERDLGFQREQQIVVPFRTEEARKQLATFKQEVQQLPEVQSVSGLRATPGQFVTQDFAIYTAGKDMTQTQLVKIVDTDEAYLETLNIPLVQGRALLPSDTANQVVLNQRALQALGIAETDAPGTVIYTDFDGEQVPFRIVGVMQDFNFHSLRSELTPLMLRYREPQRHLKTLIRTDTDDYGATIAAIGRVWRTLNPDLPFEYSFLDEDLQRQYEAEANLARIVTLFTLMAILISCMGLFGLSTFSIERKVKEIGIRKVLGASTWGLVGRLSGEFLGLVLLALLLASPLAWYFMRQWLSEFAYHIRIQWWIFTGVGGFALLLAFLTVSIQALRAASANPVEALKRE